MAIAQGFEIQAWPAMTGSGKYGLTPSLVYQEILTYIKVSNSYRLLNSNFA